MALLVLKLVLTPLFIGGASIAARRRGPAFGGWLISLPLTSGPVALFLALDQGPAFGSAAAEASLAGCIAISAYGLIYARTGPRYGWRGALGAGLAGWLAAALAVQPMLHWPVPALFALVALVIIAAVQLMPARSSAIAAATWSRWDVPVRMAVATSVVIGVTAAAPLLGTGPSGLLAMLPMMGTILAVFAHRAGGTSDGIAVQRGILSGLIGTAAFLAVVAGSIENLGVVASFGVALVTVILIQAVILLVLRAGSTAQAGGLAGRADKPMRPAPVAGGRAR